MAQAAAACKQNDGGGQKSFLQVGEFSAQRVSPDLTKVRDSAGRTLYLHPEAYPNYPRRYFAELPATDPATEGRRL
jgi:hypothetical protein